MGEERVPYLGPGEVDRLVDPEALVEDVAWALLEANAPPRATLEHGDTWFAAMPAAAGGFIAAKLVGVYPRNPRRRLPLVRGLLLLFDAETGELLLAADASAATGWRTAAATALALRLLGAPRGASLGVIGAGVQAEYHLRLLRALFEPREVMVTSRRPWRAAAVAARHGGVAVDRERLLKESEIVVAATSSTRPVVEARLLRWGTVVASVGAPRPVREIDTETLLRAGCAVVDTAEGTRRETDDVDEALVETIGLRVLLRGGRCGWRELRLYKSVGTAQLDLAIAAHLYRRLEEAGRG